LVLSQQPLGQVHGCTHAPARQNWPVWQREQLLPPVPQAFDVLPGWQLPC
jgi:hypothetical protein